MDIVCDQPNESSKQRIYKVILVTYAHQSVVLWLTNPGTQVCTVQRAAGMRRHLVSEIVTKFFLAHASKIHAHTPLTFFVTSAILHPHIGTYSLIWFLSKSTPFKAVMQV